MLRPLIEKVRNIIRLTSVAKSPAAILLLATLLLFTRPVFAQQDVWDGVSRIVAVGDIHGDYDNYLEVLKDAGLISRSGNWRGGDTHLVQVGDLPDRGPDTDKVIKHLQKIARQAEKDGGMVHVLIGNHEMMNMLGDLRYVHPGEYVALKSRNSRRLQDAYYQQYVEYMSSLYEGNPEEADQLFDDAHRESWNLEYPLGYVEHRITWSPEGDFGSWVVGHNAVIKINNILFMHGGMGPDMPHLGITEINDQIKMELAAGSVDMETSLVDMQQGPLWYRGLARNPESQEQANVEALLERYQVDYIVVGHTPGLGTIVPRFDGRVFIIDTGISDYYGGYMASLIFEDGEIKSSQFGEEFTMPTNFEETVDYFETVLDNSGTAIPALETHLENYRNQTEVVEAPVID